MLDVVFKTTGILLGILEKVLKANLHVEGLENLVPNPTLFVVNHFTRIETFLLPYVLHKHNGIHVHSLADSSLFHGIFGSYLRSMGTLSGREPFRNRTIIGELLTGAFDWVIYPEGVMVKNKKIFEHGRFRMDTPRWKGPPHTGAALLALRTELVKHDILQAQAEGNTELIEHYQARYMLSDISELSEQNTVIVPVNITYYPLRPGKNLLSDMAALLFSHLPQRLEEELKTEGNILFSDADITIYFGAPIDVATDVKAALNLHKKYHALVRYIPKDKLTIGLKRKKLTQHFMREIYTKVDIHIDHLFCMGLRKLKRNTIKEEDFCRALYLSAVEIRNLEKRRTHPTLQEDILKVITGETYPPYESICKQAEKEGVLTRAKGVLHINKRLLERRDLPFHEIRLKRITAVIANELQPLRRVVGIVERNVNRSGRALKARLVDVLSQSDQERFERDYEDYYEEGLSKPRSVGQPFFLKAKNRSVGVVLSHGYLAAPEEVRLMAEYLLTKGISVYGPCLKGMGTAPRQLADVTWENWVHAYERAYAAISNTCDKIIVGGFSSGGLLALLSAARKPHAAQGVFCINAPLILEDIKTRLVPASLAWNELLERFHISSGKLEFVDNEPENPEINYTLNYVKGLRELDHLISECRKNLEHVTDPALVISSKDDPVVNPKSADIIFSTICSEKKDLASMDFDRHVIVRREGCERVFEKVYEFIKSVT